jgi:hypothetical protein
MSIVMSIVHTNNIPVSEKLYNLEVWLPSGTFDMVLSSSPSKVLVLWKNNKIFQSSGAMPMSTPLTIKISLAKLKCYCGKVDERSYRRIFYEVFLSET